MPGWGWANYAAEGLSSAAGGVADAAQDWRKRQHQEAEAAERKRQFNETLGLQAQQLGQTYAEMDQRGRLEQARLGQARDLARDETLRALATGGFPRQAQAYGAGTNLKDMLWTDAIAREDQENAAKLALLTAQAGAQTAQQEVLRRPPVITLGQGQVAVQGGQTIGQGLPARETSPWRAAGGALYHGGTGEIRELPAQPVPVMYTDPTTGQPRFEYVTAPRGVRPAAAPRPPAEPRPDPAEAKIAAEVGHIMRESAGRGDTPEQTRALLRQYYVAINRPDMIPASPLRQELEKALGAVQAKKEMRPAPPKRKQNIKKQAPRRPQQSSMTPGAR